MIDVAFHGQLELYAESESRLIEGDAQACRRTRRSQIHWDRVAWWAKNERWQGSRTVTVLILTGQ